MRRLPIVFVVLSTFAEAGHHWTALCRVLIVPAAALAALEVLQGQSGASLWWLVPTVPIGVLFATSCHRTILLGDKSLPNPLGVYWTIREIRFFGWSLVPLLLYLLAVALPVFLLVSDLGSKVLWVIITLAIPTSYVASRVSLLLPSTAIDQRLGLRKAWDLSRHNGWRLTLALSIPGLLLTALRYIIYEFVCGAPEGLIPMTLLALSFCLIGAVQVIVLSVAFRWLSSDQRAKAPA